MRTNRYANRLAEMAFIGIVSVSALIGSNVANAQQGKLATPADSTGQVLSAEADPNLPGMSFLDLSKVGVNINLLKVRWNYGDLTRKKPILQIVDPATGVGAGEYLGWNNEGSWMVTARDGKVRVWNLQNNTLTERYRNYGEFPKATLLTLKNSSYKEEYLAEQNKRGPTAEPKPLTQVAKNDTGSRDQQGNPATPANSASQASNPEADPNLPGMSFQDLFKLGVNVNVLKVRWNYTDVTRRMPVLQIVDPAVGVESGSYLGWNGEGSWMVTNDGKVRVWNLQSNSLIERYNTFNDFPKTTFLALKNSRQKEQYLAAQRATEAQAKPPTPVAKSDTGPLADAARTAVGRVNASQPVPHTAAGGYNAKGASLKGDILTLTKPDGQVVTFKVERQGNQQSSGDNAAGTWLAFADNKVITVQGDGQASVLEMDPRLRAVFLQMKQMAAGPH